MASKKTDADRNETEPAKKKPTRKKAAKKPAKKKVAKKGAEKASKAPKKVSARKPKAQPRAKAKQEGLNILFAASECTPFAKTGGLADVVGSLPKVLREMGHDARVVLPLYAMIDRSAYGITWQSQACIHMGAGVEHWVGLHAAELDGVPVYFVDYGAYFDRPGIYDGPWGAYTDNAFRYALLCKAAMQLCKDYAFIPDVMHVHDWHTALGAAFLKTWDRILSPLSNTASVLTIHNIGYQGVHDAEVYPYLGIGGEYFNPEVFENYGRVNLLKGGVHFADAITTVSPTHREEMLDSIGGQGLTPYLNNRAEDFFGILNGVDYKEWNPKKDKYIPATFSPRHMDGKKTCKAELQRLFGLEVRDDVPLFGVVSRFAPQKGFDLITRALPEALNHMSMQVVVLGTGDPDTEGFFHWLAHSYGGKAGVHIGFSVDLSHMIEAGSDFFMMPSLYEPCGLNQMYSLKYGTLPLVRATGGLEDSVVNYDEALGTGTGFKFIQPTVEALYDTLGWAVSTWYDRPDHIEKMRQQAMAEDFSWDKSAAEYVKVYQHAMANRRK